MNEIKPLINGRAYDWARVAIKMSTASQEFTAVDAIEYGEDNTVTNNYGAGRMPVSRSYGNIESSASITLHLDEVAAIMDSVETGRLADIPEFDIIVAYLHPDSGKLRRDVLKNCKFAATRLSLNQNDSKFPVELPLTISHINWGGRPFRRLLD